jgi:hypothetical protein
MTPLQLRPVTLSACPSPSSSTPRRELAPCSPYLANLDIGLFGQLPVARVLTFTLPVTPSSNLANALLSAQGVAVSAATPFGLASSNGTEVVVGF